MITTRRATLDDVPLLVTLMREFYAESALSLDERWAADSFFILLSDSGKGAVWIASDGDEPAGYIVLTVRHSMEYGGPDGFIDDLYVRPAHRRRGLGAAALEALLAESRQRELKALHVETARDQTPGRRLYEGFDFGVADEKRELLSLRLSSSTPKASPATQTEHRGSCACGAVRVEAKGEPYRVGVCHCLACRKAHGAPFNFYAVFPPEAVTVRGDVITFASSEKARRYSCRNCGAPIYSTYGRDDEFYLHPGSFDDIGVFMPTYELWMRRREPWLPAFPTTVSHFVENRLQWKRREPE